MARTYDGKKWREQMEGKNGGKINTKIMAEKLI
jgi:hypothetical protein